MDLDEARRVIGTPTGLLGVDRVVGHQRVGRVDGHRFAGAAVGLEGHGAGDVLLVGDQERFEVVTQRFVEEAAKDEIGPLPCGVLFEGRLGFGQREFFKTAVGHQQGFDAGALKDDASLQAHDGVAGVDAAAHAVGAEGLVQLREHVGPGDGLAIQRHRDAALEFDGALGGSFGPLRPGLAHAVGVFARGTKLVDLGTGDGGAEQIFVDGVLLVMVGHVKAAGLEVVHLVGPEGFGFRLDVANRCEHGQVADRTQGLVKAELVVAHGGAPVGDRGRAETLGDLHEFFHDDVAVGTQQGIPLLVLLAAHHKGLHKGIPQTRVPASAVMCSEAPSSRARFLMASDSPGARPPVSTCTVTTWWPRSMSQGTQNEVSSPPEKASTVGAVDMGILYRCTGVGASRRAIKAFCT